MLARRMHLSRLEEVPRKVEEAFARKRQQDEARAAWLADEAEFARFAKEVPVPLVANLTEFGQSALLPFATFQQLGYGAVLYPVTLLRSAMGAVARTLAALQREGTQAGLLGEMLTRQQLYDLVGYTD